MLGGNDDDAPSTPHATSRADDTTAKSREFPGFPGISNVKRGCDPAVRVRRDGVFPVISLSVLDIFSTSWTMAANPLQLEPCPTASNPLPGATTTCQGKAVKTAWSSTSACSPELLPEVATHLRSLGMSAADTAGVMGGNWMRVARQVWKS
jgi:hypothetical protein